MALKEYILGLLGNRFIGNVSVLASGAVIGQVVTMASLPIVTRFYTPTNFELLAVYASLLSIVSVAACLRLEIAIPLPETDSEAVNLLALALFGALAVSVATGMVVYVCAPYLGQAEESIGRYLWLLPVGVLTSATYNAFQYWSTRKGKFGLIARTRFTRAVGGASTQLGLGVVNAGAIGLIAGHIVSAGAGILSLSTDFVKRDIGLLRNVSRSTLIKAIVKYKRYPQISSFEALANSTAFHVPVILISLYADGPEAGYLFLALKVMQAPLGLISGSVAQVYIAEAGEQNRLNSLGTYTAAVMGGLIVTGTGPILVAGVIAPDLFEFAFGTAWRRAGVLVTWLTPAILLQFFTSPVSMSLNISDNQDVALRLQMLGLVVRVVPIVVAGYIWSEGVSAVYAASGAVFYLAYLLVVLGTLSVPYSNVWREIAKHGKVNAIWIAVLSLLALVKLVMHLS